MGGACSVSCGCRSYLLPFLCAAILVSGCVNPPHEHWKKQLSSARQTSNRAGLTTSSLRADLAEVSLDGGPDYSLPVNELPSILKDTPWLNIKYSRYPDWVMGRLWTQYAANMGRKNRDYGWRDDLDFGSCDCWLYVETSLPTIGRRMDDPDAMHNHAVYAFLVKGESVLAAVRIAPWKGTVDLHDLGEPNKASANPASPSALSPKPTPPQKLE